MWLQVKGLITLLNRGKSNSLPAHSSHSECFSYYFVTKIDKTRESLNSDFPFSGRELLFFQEVTHSDIGAVVKNISPKQCVLDPLPTWLIKQCSDAIVPIITSIVNIYLSQSLNFQVI